MNCEEIRKLLAEGRPLTDQAQKHVDSCAGCRTMIEALNQQAAGPDPRRLAEIESTVLAGIKPVRPLPSDRVLITIAVLSFIGFSVLPTIRYGMTAVRVFSGFQQVAYYSLIAFLAILFSAATVQNMIPGSRKYVSVRALLVGSFLALALVASVLFENFSTAHFVEYGLPCLKLGTACAVVSGILAFSLIRKGFFTSRLASGTLLGFFAGLSGVGALALICPVRNAAHIIVWHLGTMVIGGLAGTLIGLLVERREPIGNLAEE